MIGGGVQAGGGDGERPGGDQSGGGVGGPPATPCGSFTIAPFVALLGQNLCRFAPRLAPDGTVFATE